jgi:hypothetical protein
MNMPGFTAELSLFKSQRSYRGIIGAASGGPVMLQQNIVARPPVIPPIGINCNARHRSCEWGCNFGYWTCMRGGTPERTCAHRYFVCSDTCDVEWEICRGLYRDPNYDPFADHFGGVG